MEMKKSEMAYLDELAADIAKHGFDGNIEQAIIDAHARRQKFTVEMFSQKTERSRMAKEAIMTNVWIRSNISNANKKLIDECERIKHDF